ncbi:MAG: adenylyltransferase/cytidyltransferase family protein [Armatimonadota bacterium]
MSYPPGLSAKLCSLDDLAARGAGLRKRGLTVVVAGGCFDLLHIGHVRTLQSARALGDYLIVLVNSDTSVRRLKGPGRPLIPEAERLEMLAAFACVDAVLLFDEDSPAPLLARLKPDVFCKGADYAPPGGKTLPPDEVAAMAAAGGRIEYLPLAPDNSTTAIIRRIMYMEGEPGL